MGTRNHLLASVSFSQIQQIILFVLKHSLSTHTNIDMAFHDCSLSLLCFPSHSLLHIIYCTYSKSTIFYMKDTARSAALFKTYSVSLLALFMDAIDSSKINTL